MNSSLLPDSFRHTNAYIYIHTSRPIPRLHMINQSISSSQTDNFYWLKGKIGKEIPLPTLLKGTEGHIYFPFPPSPLFLTFPYPLPQYPVFLFSPISIFTSSCSHYSHSSHIIVVFQIFLLRHYVIFVLNTLCVFYPLFPHS